jgi:membrane protein
MRKFAYAISTMALDVIITLLFLRPYFETSSFFSGNLEALGTIVLLLVPTMTAIFLFVVDNIGKEEKNKRNLVLLIFGILVISGCLIYYIKPTKSTLILTIATMSAIECLVAKAYCNVNGNDTPRSIFNVIWDLGLSMLTWKYFCTTNVGWLKALPEWGIISISIFIVLLSIFLQYAGEKFLKVDAIIGGAITIAATIAWILMNQKAYMADNRSMRFILIILFSGLVYFGVLYFGEKMASGEK